MITENDQNPDPENDQKKVQEIQKKKRKWKERPNKEKIEIVLSATIKAGITLMGYLAVLPILVGMFMGYFGLYWFLTVYLELNIEPLFWDILSISMVCLTLLLFIASVILTEYIYKQLKREYQEEKKQKEKRKREKNGPKYNKKSNSI